MGGGKRKTSTSFPLKPRNLGSDNIKIYKNIKDEVDTLCRLLSKKEVPKEDISYHKLAKDFPDWELAQYF